MQVIFTEDEIQGLMEAIDRGHDDRTDYMTCGNPHTDYGAEWPETAREQARRWDNAASACRKLEAESMAEACESLARSLRAGADEYEKDNGGTE